MAQVGDTITYTFSDGTSVAEDVSSVDEVVVEYCDGAGGNPSANGSAAGGSGGRVEGTVVDVSGVNTIYIWVSGGFFAEGRYNGGTGQIDFSGEDGGNGGGSTEISLVDTNSSQSDTEPLIVGAGGGGGGGVNFVLGGDGARGGFENSLGAPPPQGGSGNGEGAGGDGDGAVDGHGTTATITNTGTTIQGGGSPSDADGEIKLSFNSFLSPPDPPSNLTAEVQ